MRPSINVESKKHGPKLLKPIDPIATNELVLTCQLGHMYGCRFISDAYKEPPVSRMGAKGIKVTSETPEDLCWSFLDILDFGKTITREKLSAMGISESFLNTESSYKAARGSARGMSRILGVLVC